MIKDGRIENERLFAPSNNDYNHFLKVNAEIVAPWKPKEDTFFLRNSTPFLMALPLLPGYETSRNVFMHPYLKFSRAQKFSRFVFAFPACIALSGVTAVTQEYFVKKDILLGMTACPLCVQTRSMSLALLTTVAIPSIFCGVAAAGYAKMETKKDISFTQILRNSFKASYPLLGLYSFTALCASFYITYEMQNEWRNISDILSERESAAKVDQKIQKKND